MDPPALVVQVGKTRLSYQLRALEDAHAMLKSHWDWMPLGNADEGKPTKEGTLEHWARSESNPANGYYGLRKGYRGRFANYVAPTLELLGLVELEHRVRNNRYEQSRQNYCPLNREMAAVSGIARTPHCPGTSRSPA